MLLVDLFVFLSVFSVAFSSFQWKNCIKVPDSTSPNVTSVHGCEDKTSVNLSCPSGYKISIVKAFFGHGNGHKAKCDSSWISQDCESETAMDKIKFLCQNRQSCSVKATSTVLGSPSCWFGLDADLFIDYVCNKESVPDVVTLKSMTLVPSPLILPGHVNTSISIMIKRSLPSTTKLKLTVQKMILGAVWMSIPCLSNYGSCTYDNFCDLLRGMMFSKCDRGMENSGVPCNCPIPTGLFTIPTQVVTVTKDMIEQLPVWNWLVNGKYRVKAEFMDVYDNLIGCIQIQLEVNVNSKKKRRSLLYERGQSHRLLKQTQK